MASGTASRPFSWTQRPGRIDVSLIHAAGQTVAEISVTPDAATLTQSNREPRTAKDIDTLTQQALGWSLPVAGLRDWLQGYATDAQGKRFAASPANNNVFTRTAGACASSTGRRGRRPRCRASSKPNAAPPPTAATCRSAS
jgi:outer membrane biogenesis lipoprotein LolB